MLLELPVSSLTQLLKNREALKEAVMKAKGEYLKFITVGKIFSPLLFRELFLKGHRIGET